LSFSCTTHAEHIIRFENNVFVLALHPKPCLVPHT
jgi:hypothetical protein